jgi:hypothetical protein
MSTHPTTPEEKSLFSQIQECDRIARGGHQPEVKNGRVVPGQKIYGRDESTPHGFVLKHGRFWVAGSNPADIEWMERGRCFSSARKLACDQPERFTYVEGYAWDSDTHSLIHHGWIVDSDGLVVDPTRPEGSKAYFGVAFKTAYLESCSTCGGLIVHPQLGNIPWLEEGALATGTQP